MDEGVSQMSSVPHGSHDGSRQVDLTRSQQWVLHHVMVSRCRRARADRRTPPWWTVDVVEKVEDGVLALSPFEARRVRVDLREFAYDAATPAEDARAALAVVDEIERTFGDLSFDPDG